MPKKKKEEGLEGTPGVKKITKKKTGKKDESKTEVTLSTEESKEEKKSTKSTTSKKKNYELISDTKISYYEASQIILRIDDREDIVKKFDATTRLSYDVVGKATKYAPDKWGKIVEVIPGTPDLIYRIETIAK